MITILNISDTKFSYNGIAYFKNFTPFVTGNKVNIVNTYDACISLTNFPTIYSDISVDGVIYGSVAALQNALLPVLFNRTFTQAGSLAIGFIPKSNGSNSLGNSIIYESSDGKIGIGTINPISKLHVAGTMRTSLPSGAGGDTLISAIEGVSNGYLISVDTSNNITHTWHTGVNNPSLRITSGGNVGIGTTAPAAKLEVAGRIATTGGTSNDVLSQYVTLKDITSTNDYVLRYQNSSGSQIGYIGVISSENKFTYQNTNGHIFSGGNVGIGTTLPDNGKLTILKATSRATASSYGISIQSNVSNAYTELLLGADDAVDCGIIQSAAKNINFTNKKLALQPQGGNTGIGGTSPLQTLDVFGVLRISSSAPTQEFYSNANGDVWGSVKAQASGTGSGASLVFSTKRDGNSASDKMIITQAGDVLIGTTTNTYASKIVLFGGSQNNTLECVHTGTQNTYNMIFSNGNGGVGSITTNGSATAFNTSSDYRLKQDLKSINGLDLVSKIKVYDYEWKSDKTRAYGVLAHELQEVIPQAVNGEKDDEQMQSVDYSKLVPILVASIKELKQEIQILKN